MTKNFPKTRVCAINANDVLKRAVKQSIQFASTHNINISSKDGRNILLSNCLQEIQHLYNHIDSPFRKVLFLSKSELDQKLLYFIENYFNKMMSRVPIPYCGVVSVNSPDLESISERCIDQLKPQKNFSKLKRYLNLKVS